jgi:hypothetical protein
MDTTERLSEARINTREARENTRRLEKLLGVFVRSITPGRRYKGLQGGRKKY